MIWVSALLWQIFSIGTVAAYSAKYNALVAYKVLELFQYQSLSHVIPLIPTATPCCYFDNLLFQINEDTFAQHWTVLSMMRLMISINTVLTFNLVFILVTTHVESKLWLLYLFFKLINYVMFENNLQICHFVHWLLLQ